MEYIDIHTHNTKNSKAIELINVFANQAPESYPDSFFSLGLHPWHIETVNIQECFENIGNAVLNKKMLAIGECGIDRAISTPINIQEDYFRKQINIAENNKLPIIIHCVRAYSDLIRIKKETKSKTDWILHAYCGNKETTKHLIKHGFYFSLGKSLIQGKIKPETLKLIPLDRLFFETDDNEIYIKSLYDYFSEISEIDSDFLCERVLNNFRKIFLKD